MDSTALQRPWPVSRSRRLLGALGDERLTLEAKRGNERAFEAIYDRYHRPLLNFCRHMLGSREDSEDALQHTFGAAFRALPSNEQPALLKPWLFAIARNQCLSVLRRRREQPLEKIDQLSSAGLSEEVEQRAELRALLVDLEHLPERQRAALLLSEAADLGHAEIAQILECATEQVKSLVFQARSSLTASRTARAVPCVEIREQLATATGAGRRYGMLRRHVRTCAGCAEFDAEMRRQRELLAIALPVVPSLGLKQSVLAAASIGGGGGAAGGGGVLAPSLAMAWQRRSPSWRWWAAERSAASRRPSRFCSRKRLPRSNGWCTRPASPGQGAWRPSGPKQANRSLPSTGEKPRAGRGSSTRERLVAVRRARINSGEAHTWAARVAKPFRHLNAGQARPAPVNRPSGGQAVELLARAGAARGAERARLEGGIIRMLRAGVEAREAALTARPGAGWFRRLEGSRTRGASQAPSRKPGPSLDRTAGPVEETAAPGRRGGRPKQGDGRVKPDCGRSGREQPLR